MSPEYKRWAEERTGIDETVRFYAAVDSVITHGSMALVGMLIGWLMAIYIKG